MSFRNFILGLSASFGLAWVCVVIVPFFKMRDLAAIPLGDGTEEDAGFYYPKRAGRIADGARVYAENGCYLCHTQVIRPTYAGNDMFRPDWAGFISEDRGDTRRETNAFDFFGEEFAQIGVSRMGPDLSNLAYRVEADKFRTVSPEAWLYLHLYDSRIFAERRKSNCPPMPFLFDKSELVGVRSADALPVGDMNQEIVPNPDARALVSYLLSLKKDQEVPPSLNFSPATAEAGN